MLRKLLTKNIFASLFKEKAQAFLLLFLNNAFALPSFYSYKHKHLVDFSDYGQVLDV